MNIRTFLFGQKPKDDWKSTFSPPLSKEIENEGLVKYLKEEEAKEDAVEEFQISIVLTASNGELAAMIHDKSITRRRVHQVVRDEALARILKKL